MLFYSTMTNSKEYHIYVCYDTGNYFKTIQVSVCYEDRLVVSGNIAFFLAASLVEDPKPDDQENKNFAVTLNNVDIKATSYEPTH